MNKKALIRIVSFVILVPWTVRGETPPTWEQVPAILARIIPAKFPDKQIDVTTYGAMGDGQTDCFKAIRDAIDACSKAGGGRVVVPAGQFLCNGPIHLKSHVNLQLSEGCTLLFGTNPDDYLVGSTANGGGVLVRWEGTRCYNYSPLIYAYQQTNISVTGRGTIDGQTRKFWSPWKSKQRGAQQTLRDMGKTGVPIEKRVFGRGHFLRPSLFSPYQCDKVLMEGVTVKGSPFWTIHPVLCNQVVIRDVTVEPGTTNDDGCDPESCTDVLIEGCTFDTNDDNIAIKAGRDNDAWAANGGKACENIVIRNCTFKRGTPGGISIGSEMSGDVRNVFIEKCKMGSVNRPIYIKSNPDRGGMVENIWARDITVDSCTILFHCEMSYKRVTQGPSMPAFRDVHIENIACKKANKAIDCQGLPGHPIRNVSIRNMTVDFASTPLTTGFVEGLRMENVKVNGVILTPDSN